MFKKTKKFTALLLVLFIFFTVNIQTVEAIQKSMEPESDYYDIENYWAKPEIDRLISEGVVDGTLKDGFKVIEPKESITRAEFVKLTINSLMSDSEMSKKLKQIDKNSVFSDINSHWAFEYIILAHDLGIIDGYENGEFKPNDSITRSEVAKIIIASNESFNKNDIQNNSTFIDVSTDNWAFEYINKAKSINFINGYKGNRFKPNKEITRAESMVVIDRYIDINSKKILTDRLKNIVVEASANKVDINDTVTFSVKNNILKDKLSGIKRSINDKINMYKSD